MSDMLHNPNHTEARDQAIDWARRAFNTTFLIFDLETTGLGPTAAPVSIGAITSTGNELLNLRLNPERPIEQGASDTHGIVAEMVQDCPTFGEAFEDILRAFGPYPHAYAYNFAYDGPILNRMCAEYGKIKLFRPGMETTFCAMHAFAAFAGEWHDYYKNYRYQKLTTAARTFGLAWGESTAHDALADCWMTLRVMRALALQHKSAEQKLYTAQELADNPWWMELELTVRYPNGELTYDGAYHTGGQGKTIRMTQGSVAAHVYPRKGFKLDLPPA